METNKLVDFVIVSPPRTGSTFLMRLLNTHPDITCAEEIFGVQVSSIPGLERFPYSLTVKQRTHYPRIIQRAISAWNTYIKALSIKLQARRDANPVRYVLNIRKRKPVRTYFGFKLITSHGFGMSFLPTLKPQKIITTRRRNIIKQAISLEMARMLNNWQAVTKEQSYPSIYFDPQLLHEGIDRIETQVAYLDKSIAALNCEHLEIFYEEFFKDIPATLQKLADFFCVDVQGFKPEAVQIYKITNPDLRHVLRNFDELHQLLKTDEHKKMLEDTDI